MRLSRKHYVITMIISFTLAVVACSNSGKHERTDNSSKSGTSTSTQTTGTYSTSSYEHLTLAYEYDGEFSVYDVADAATAYDGSTIVATAITKDLQQVGGTTHIEVEEMHFDKTTGAETYRGTLLFSIAVDGRPVSETQKFGKKSATVFSRWPWGHATYRIKIEYTYNGTIPGGYYALADGAKAYDMNGKLVADAIPLRVTKEDGLVLEVEEVHYLGVKGRESYRGILRFETGSGLLVGEIPKAGSKQRVVFADWP